MWGARRLETREAQGPRARMIVPRARKIVPRARKIVPRARMIVPRARMIVPRARKIVPRASSSRLPRFSPTPRHLYYSGACYAGYKAT